MKEPHAGKKEKIYKYLYNSPQNSVEIINAKPTHSVPIIG